MNIMLITFQRNMLPPSSGQNSSDHKFLWRLIMVYQVTWRHVHKIAVVTVTVVKASNLMIKSYD
jgi:hypothetical protein